MDTITFDNGYLRRMDESDFDFFQSMFDVPDILRYYCLTEEQENNLYQFFMDLLRMDQMRSALDYIIVDNYGNNVGYISGEVRDGSEFDYDNITKITVAYAIMPKYRNMGFATQALKVFTDFIFINSDIPVAYLDINNANKASQHVAINAGYVRDSFHPYIDSKHLDAGTRCMWYAYASRHKICEEAMYLARVDRDAQAVELFELALKQPHDNGSPYTDAQIMSNMGICLSQIGKYYEAYDCLQYAIAHGLDNPSIQKELRWLKENQGIG